MKARYLFILLSLVTLTSCEIIIHNEEPIFFDQRDKFTGSFRLEEVSNTYNEIAEYSISIYKSSHDTDVVFIRNFYGVNIEAMAIVRGDKLILPLQEIDGYEIEGEVWYHIGELEFDYVVRDITRHQIINDYCTAVAW